MKNKNCKDVDKKEISQHKWIFNEYFLPNCDESFFQNNHMQDIITEIFGNMESGENGINFRMFRNLQKVMPKPRLFT